jgi:2'-hydroxyisoflavone reductase
MTTRRHVLQVAAGLGLAGLSAPKLHAATAPTRTVEPSAAPLKLLILGGTGFIGPHQVEYALARGHTVTVFNRGRKSGLFGERVEELQGDRDSTIDSGLTALAGDRTWDVVIDNSGYVPRHVRDSATLLKDRCRRYVYVSTVAVYPEFAGVFGEDAPIAELEDKSIEDVSGATYGPLKAECDRVVIEVLGAKGTIVRPTYIVGPGDTTDRFTYWVDRMQRGGDVVGAAHTEVGVQVVDVRDLCPWVVTLAENDTPGIFNAAGPVFTRVGFLWGLRASSAADVTFHWPTPELVAELELPAPMLDWGSHSQTFPGAASIAKGMKYRSLAESAAGTLEWWRAQTDERRSKARGWPTPELEAAAVARLKG